jgi:WXG100 family type VII secretion target
MDHGEIFAKITQMREAAATMGRSASNIDSSLQAVDREIRALGSDRFMSIGAEAFRGEYNRLTPRLQDAFELLRRFQDKLQTSADDIEMAARGNLSGGAS